MKRTLACAAAALALAGCATTPPSGGDAFAVALIGDMPYTEQQVAPVGAMLAAIGADPEVQFVLHTGDVKGGAERCDDALLRQRHAQIQASRHPVIYTPGDNEWTDCHRPTNGRFVPTERLDFLRKLFFAQPGKSLGQRTLDVVSQATMPGHETFVENVLFLHRRVLFASVHVVGSKNGLDPWTGLDRADSAAAPRADREAEVKAREAAALAWIDRAFDEAQARDAAGVLLLMQANPGIDTPPGSPQRVGFEALLAKLKDRALRFGKPVVLAQGDNHELLIDMPLYRDAEPAPKVPRFTRIQGFGAPRLHWVKLRIDPASVEVFRFEPQLAQPSMK